MPFVAFVALEGGASSSCRREPGFLLVTTWGQVLYWSSISAALSGLHNHEDRSLGLASGEVVRAMTALSVRKRHTRLRATVLLSQCRIYYARITVKVLYHSHKWQQAILLKDSKLVYGER